MSGLMHKVKDALHGGHKDEAAKLEHEGLQGEHGSQSGVHDTPVSGSVAHGDSVSPTNPGVLHSTKHGIHGDRDTGTSGTGLSNQGLTGQTGIDGESSSVAHGSSVSPTNPGVLHSTKPGIHGARDAGTGGTGLSNSELMQDSGVGAGRGPGIGSEYDSTLGGGHHERDAGLAAAGAGVTGAGLVGAGRGSGTEPRLDSTSQDTGLGHGHHTGNQYESSKHDAGLAGAGLGRGTTMDESALNAGSESRYNPTDRSGAGLDGQDVLTGTGSYTRDGDNTTTGTGLGRDEGLTSGGTGSGLTGNTDSGYTSNTPGTGLAGGRGTDSGLTGGDSGMGSGLTDTGMNSATSGTAHHSGLGEKAERYVEGSEQHHRGDGHPEDIVHPGPHLSATAKALDPHLH